jgi:hypothetical protein
MRDLRKFNKREKYPQPKDQRCFKFQFIPPLPHILKNQLTFFAEVHHDNVVLGNGAS